MNAPEGLGLSGSARDMSQGWYDPLALGRVRIFAVGVSAQDLAVTTLPDQLHLLREHRGHLADAEFRDAYAADRPLFVWEFRHAYRYTSAASYEHPHGVADFRQAIVERLGAVRVLPAGVPGSRTVPSALPVVRRMAEKLDTGVLMAGGDPDVDSRTEPAGCMTDWILGDASVGQLLAAYRSILHELRSRGVLRTANAPTGDYAEYLIAAHLGGELAPNSEKSWDVRSGDGRRIQVKARVVAEPSSRGDRQLSVIRTWDFDLLAVVLFNGDFTVRRVVLVDLGVAKDAARFVRHVNGYRIMATDEFLNGPGTEDITASVGETAARI